MKENNEENDSARGRKSGKNRQRKKKTKKKIQNKERKRQTEERWIKNDKTEKRRFKEKRKS